MSDQPTSNEATNDEESTPAAPRRRSRRATRPVMTPAEREAAEQQAQAEQQVADGVSIGDDAATDDGGTAVAQEVSPAQGSAGEPASVGPDEVAPAGTEIDVDADGETDEEQPEEGAGSEASEGLDVFAALGVDPSQAAPAQTGSSATQVDVTLPERDDQPAKSQRRKGKSPADEASAEDAAASAGSGTDSGADRSGPQAADGDDVTSGAGDAQSETGAPDTAAPATATGTDEGEDESESPRLPATALLFQAPEPARGRRSRRAGAPAGPPVVSDDQDTTDEGSAAKQREESEKSGAKSTSGGSRGRNGGKAGSGQDSKGKPDQSSRSGQDEASDDGDDDGADTSGEGSSGEGSAAKRRRRRRGGRGRRRGGGQSGGEGSADQSQDSSGDDDAGKAKDSETTTDEGSRKNDDGNGKDDAKSDGGNGNGDAKSKDDNGDGQGQSGSSSSSKRRRRRSRGSRGSGSGGDSGRDEVTALKGSTRLEAKKQRRRDGRDSQRRRSIITEAEFLARRESVQRDMVVRERDGRTQVAVLEDEVLVEHYVARKTQTSMVGNVHLGRVQNVLPSMEAAFIDIGKGRNAVLYAGEVNWDAAGLEGQPRRIEQALSSGDSVLVQVTKDPVGHKGARLTSQITLAGRYLVLVPSGAMTGISRKLPDTERNRLKKLLKEIVPDDQGVIVRTAAEGASEDELRRDVERLGKQWADIQKKINRKSVTAPTLLKGEPELSLRVVRDVFNEDFSSLTISGDEAWKTISEYVESVAPDLRERVYHWTDRKDLFAELRIDEQIAKALDRKVWLPSGGSLIIDRTEAMTVVDVNTGKFTGSGGTLEETVTRNNLEAAEEIVRQLRLRDIGGIIVVDFIDMVLEANRDLVLRRLVECLGRDRTRHQVAEVTSLGLVQMTRKRIGQGLLEAFSDNCEHCNGRGYHVHAAPVDPDEGSRRGKGKGSRGGDPSQDEQQRAQVRAALANIAAAAATAHAEQDAKEAKEAEQADDAESPEGAAEEAPGTEGDDAENGGPENGGPENRGPENGGPDDGKPEDVGAEAQADAGSSDGTAPQPGAEGEDSAPEDTETQGGEPEADTSDQPDKATAEQAGQPGN